MSKPALALALAALACAAAPRPKPPRGPVVFEIRGQVENGPFRFGREDLAALPKRSFRARDPLAGREASFEGPSLGALLSTGVRVKEGADVAVVSAPGGRALAVPLVLIRQYQPVLVREGEALDLVWPNLDAPGLDSDPRARSFWVKGVGAVELVRWDRTYGPALAVPIGASGDARLGADSFAIACIGCHSVRGRGGKAGPDLTGRIRPGNEPELAAGLRRHPSGGGLFVSPSGTATARIASFLAALSRRGPLPVEQPAPEREEQSPGPPETEPPGPPVVPPTVGP